jgi:hypothetical protein
MVRERSKSGNRELGSRRWAGIASAIIVLAALAVPAKAQGADSDWTFDLALYAWATGMKGEAGAKGVSAEVDASFADIFENLEMAGMLGFSANHGRWVILGDSFFGSLGATKKGQFAKAEIDSNVMILEADLGYEVGQNVQLFGGVRRFDLDNELTVTAGALERKAKGGEAWTDPIVGLRWGVPVGERGSFWMRGDIGGFGAGSDLAWNALAGFGYAVGEKKKTTLALAYRVLDVDYEHGSGADQFLFDMQIGGPIVGAIFRFR